MHKVNAMRCEIDCTTSKFVISKLIMSLKVHIISNKEGNVKVFDCEGNRVPNLERKF